MNKQFSVTFERWDNAALEAGDTNDRGYVIQDVSLRDAIRFGLDASSPEHLNVPEPSDSHIASARWLSFREWNKYTHEWFRTGVEETRDLHIPENITPASRKRIALLFGVRP